MQKFTKSSVNVKSSRKGSRNMESSRKMSGMVRKYGKMSEMVKSGPNMANNVAKCAIYGPNMEENGPKSEDI